jgi:hypothetical protein
MGHWSHFTPPVGDVPVVGGEVGGRDNVVDGVVYSHDIEAGVEGDDIELACQAFEKKRGLTEAGNCISE